MKHLTESQKRHLSRIASLMMSGANVDLTIQMRQGGVRLHRETQDLAANDLDFSDEKLIAEIEGRALAGG